MPETLLFYDLETSGLSIAFDQVMQYAGIRTDLSGNELARESFWVQLTKDCSPDPLALLVHRQGILQCNQQGRRLDQAMQAIHQSLNHPQTLSGGYNTLGFDDEFLRFSFYRYLLTPYTHQYANGCGRFDLYPIVVLTYLFNPEALNWPEREGKPSFKLEDLNAANQLAPDAEAHHALGDVEVTVALAKRLHAYPEIWQYALGYFNKATDLARQAALPTQYGDFSGTAPLALWVEGRLGSASQYQAPVLGLGTHQQYKNQTVWLRLDQPERLFDEAWKKSPPLLRKKAAEPGFLLPLTARYTGHWSVERQSVVKEVLAWCQAHPHVIKQLAQSALSSTYQPVVCDVDAALYQGFPSARETQQAREFWQCPADQRLRLIKQWSGNLLEQGRRILWRHHAPLLAEQEEEWCLSWQAKLSTARQDHRGEKNRLLVDVIEDVEQRLANHPTPEDERLLVELAAWCLALQSNEYSIKET